MENKKIRLGLCMAGAVSAGAYTAGVVDYLIETLERWQQDKDRIRATSQESLTAQDKLVPMHDVVIEVLSGASAGGMTAAILAYSFNDNTYVTRNNKALISGVYNIPSPGDEVTKVYDCWINMVDEKDRTTFSKLMDTSDVKAIHEMGSLLNSQPIDDIAQNAIPAKLNFSPPPYISEYLSVLLTVTNLEGVPVNIRFSNINGTDPTRNVLKMHSGFLHYQFNSQQNDIDFPPEILEESTKHHLAAAAKATGAFPFGLANRKITVRNSYFNAFKKSLLDNYKINVDINLDADKDYVFNAVDGGAINNEPIGTTVKILESKKKYYHPGDENYLLLIDPFPTVTNASRAETYQEPGNYNLVQQAFKLVGALRNQSSFKQEDILKGLDMDERRYLIYPAKKKRYFLACGLIEGFSGFLKKAFREHDYQLGRKNCQAFLRYYFGETPEQFAKVTGKALTPEQEQKWRYNIHFGSKDKVPEYKIPLIPDMLLLDNNEPGKTEVAFPYYNGLTIDELKMVAKQINGRVTEITDKTYPLLVQQGSKVHRIVGCIMKCFPGFFKRKINTLADKKVNEYLRETFKPQTVKQHVLVKDFIPLIIENGKLYQKVKGVYARIANGGEQIISVVKDGVETQNTASRGDYIVRNETDSREEYLMSSVAFNNRYVHQKDDYYVPNSNARVYALRLTAESTFRMGLEIFEKIADDLTGDVYIESPWYESQVVRLNDMLVCPPSKTEVYRIAAHEFAQTYQLVEE